MFHSIKTRVIATFAVAMAIATTCAVVAGFQYIHWHEHAISDEMGLAAARSCASMFEFYDHTGKSVEDISPDSTEYNEYRESLRQLCQESGMDYLYVFTCDPVHNTITYLMCVADDDASDARVKSERAFGTVVHTELSEQEESALKGQDTQTALVFNNQFGNMLAWFSRVGGPGSMVLAGADYSVSEQRMRVFSTASSLLVPFLLLMLAILLAQLAVLKKHVFNPLRAISGRMKSFSAEKALEFEPVRIGSDDEISEITRAFNEMANDIGIYTTDIERMTAERVQADVELGVARDIQLGMVPPTTNMHGEVFDVSAFSRPAKTVGGDFYDVLVREDQSVAVVAGDVSGKGIAAALVMSATMTMIREGLLALRGPAEVLTHVNESLCKRNPEGMFVTVFALVYDPASGVVRFANAGHVPPLVVGKHTRTLKTDSGILLGLFDDAEIKEEEITLESGEALLVYTDGATEAINDAQEFFGEAPFIASIQEGAPYQCASDLVKKAVDAVDTFAGGNEQFDDLTFAALMRCAPRTTDATGQRAFAQEAPARMESFAAIRESIMSQGVDGECARKACLVAEEAFANIVSYSHASRVWFDIHRQDNALCICLADDGIPFNPTEYSATKKDFDDLDEGGMGINLMRDLASSLSYSRTDNRNILTIVVG